MALLVLEDESHNQGNDRVAARLGQMLVLRQRLDLERRMTFNGIEQADERLPAWVVFADLVGGDPIKQGSDGYQSTN